MRRNHIVPVLIIAAGVIVIVGLLYMLGYVFGVNDKNSAIRDSSNSLETASVDTPSVAPSANPINKTAPPVNPIEKANPFKNDYKNPFE